MTDTTKPQESTAHEALSTAQTVLGALNKSVLGTLPGPWQIVFMVIEEALGLGAALTAEGADPVATITELKAVAGDFNAARQRVHDAINAASQR